MDKIFGFFGSSKKKSTGKNRFRPPLIKELDKMEKQARTSFLMRDVDSEMEENYKKWKKNNYSTWKNNLTDLELRKIVKEDLKGKGPVDIFWFFMELANPLESKEMNSGNKNNLYLKF